MSITEKAANAFSEHGQCQLLVAVYHDEALVYAQVEHATLERLARQLDKCPIWERIGEAGLSRDGLTYCLHYRRREGVRGNWLWLAMMNVAERLKRKLPHLLELDGSVNYRDNRGMDADTVEAFAASI